MEEFIGFNDIIEGFNKRVDKGTLSHAHLIVGPDGIGKSILARKFALKILNKEIDKDYIDIIHYRAKKASFGVDDVRGIIEEIMKRPYEGDKKVVIIHEGNKLTIQAQNALLKTIEEPPKGVYIILLTDSIELMLDTIKSRCQIYKLTPLSKDEVNRYISRLGNFDENKVLSAIAYGEGIPGRAERILNDEKLNLLRNCIIDLLTDIDSRSNNIVLNYEKRLDSFKDSKEEVLNILESLIRDIIVYKELQDKKMIMNIDKLEYIDRFSSNKSYKKLSAMLEKIREARINISNNGNYSMVISVMLMGLSEG